MNIIVTGANTGIGYETVNSLLTLNPENKVFLACRDEAKTNVAIEKLKQQHPNSTTVEFLKLDLADLSSVQASAQAFLSKNIPLHILILNAGLLGANHKTVQGYEGMFGVNHLGHFLFTQLLLPVLKSSQPSRIVVLSSEVHQSAEENLDLESVAHRVYSNATYYKGYCNAKLMNIFFTHELARRLEGTGVTVNSLHPGAVSTELLRNTPWLLKPITGLIRLFFLTPAQGAQTSVYVATSKDVDGISGKYFDKSKETPSSPLSHNKEQEEKLWALSERLVQPFSA